MEKAYVPVNMFLDTDFGLCNLLRIFNNKPKSDNRIKRILRDRKNEIPIEEFIEKYPIDGETALFNNTHFNIFMKDGHYEKIVQVSPLFESIVNMIGSSYAFKLSDQLQFLIGYDHECEKEVLDELSNTLQNKINAELAYMKNEEIDLNDFDIIFVKVLDDSYLQWLLDIGISRKKIYVADYKFNTLSDDKGNTTIQLQYLADLEKNGNIVYTISMYDNNL